MINPLVQYIREHGVTQSEIAKMLDVTDQRISYVCRFGPGQFASAERIEDVIGIPVVAWIEWRRAVIRSGRYPAKR